VLAAAQSGKAARSGPKASSSSSSSSKASTASPRRDGADSGLYEAPADEGNDALAHMLGEVVSM